MIKHKQSIGSATVSSPPAVDFRSPSPKQKINFNFVSQPSNYNQNNHQMKSPNQPSTCHDLMSPRK